MRYISLFSGIEAASVAWKALGWTAVAFSEIEPFPCALLAKRFPEVPNLGDITNIDWSNYGNGIDLVIGGSPCQSFSYAGRREGLDGKSALMFEYVRAIREIRPRWLVWENVPGALTVENGEAFRCLLRSLDEVGYCLAWRVLDSRFFGVAQGRRRLFVVGSLGTMGAVEVLHNGESLGGNPRADRALWQSLAYGHAQSHGCPVGRDGDLITPKLVTIRCGKQKGGGRGPKISDNISATLTTGNLQILFNPTGELDEEGDPVYDVRRLTPLEVERLMGFPDGWTDIPFGMAGKCDTARYKALGNSMCVPVIAWLGNRIAMVDEGKPFRIHQEMLIG